MLAILMFPAVPEAYRTLLCVRSLSVRSVPVLVAHGTAQLVGDLLPQRMYRAMAAYGLHIHLFGEPFFDHFPIGGIRRSQCTDSGEFVFPDFHAGSDPFAETPEIAKMRTALAQPVLETGDPFLLFPLCLPVP